jgi:hypothetical protein
VIAKPAFVAFDMIDNMRMMNAGCVKLLRHLEIFYGADLDAKFTAFASLNIQLYMCHKENKRANIKYKKC